MAGPSCAGDRYACSGTPSTNDQELEYETGNGAPYGSGLQREYVWTPARETRAKHPSGSAGAGESSDASLAARTLAPVHVSHERVIRTVAGLRSYRPSGFVVRAELSTLPEPLVVTCTGLGSRTLFEDRALAPVKGQTVLLPPQPEVDYAYVSTQQALRYLFPRRNALLLGGTYERGVETIEPDLRQTEQILHDHARFFRLDHNDSEHPG